MVGNKPWIECLGLRAANLANCPECKAVRWNPTDEICELPSSESAANLQRGIEITGQVALIAGGAAITLVTGGTGAAAVVLVALEATGGAMSVAALEAQHQVAYDFLVESNKCKDASCAEAMIKENLQRLANLLNNFNDAQISAIDQELARLITLLPEDSEIFNELDSLSLAENRLSFWNSDSWEPEDVWETVGNVLSISSVITALGSSVVRQLRLATNAIATRMSTHVDDILTLTRAQAKRLDDLALEEQRLLARQAQNPGAREAAEIRSNLTRVRQERQTLLNQLGNPSEEALAAAKAEAYRLDELQNAQAELERLQQRRAELYTTNRNGQQVLRQGATRHDAQEIERQITQQQQRILELGGDVPGTTTTPPTSTATNTTDATPSSTTNPTPVTDNADDAVQGATDSADDAIRNTDSAADDAANAAGDASRADAATSPASNTTKAARLAYAKQVGRAGYHGTNVDLADDVLLQPSAGSRPEFSGVSISRDIETARNYAINRLVKTQNPHLDNGNFVYSNGVLEITSDRPLNLNNKSIYIYELETDSDGWMNVYNGYAGQFNAHYNQNATEWLAKTEENLDDLIASGRVRIIQPSAGGAARGG